MRENAEYVCGLIENIREISLMAAIQPVDFEEIKRGSLLIQGFGGVVEPSPSSYSSNTLGKMKLG